MEDVKIMSQRKNYAKSKKLWEAFQEELSIEEIKEKFNENLMEKPKWRKYKRKNYESRMEKVIKEVEKWKKA